MRALPAFLAVMLLFGCTSPGTAPEASSGPAPVQPPEASSAQPGGTLGDSDLATVETGDEAELPPEDILPPPVEAEAAAPEAVLNDSDIDAAGDEIWEDELGWDDEIVEPI